MMAKTAEFTKATTRIGFIGLGLMGSRLVKRLHADGWNVEAWNRNPEPATAISRDGIKVAASLTALAGGSDVILSCLANDAAVRSLYLGNSGVLATAKPGTVVLEMSTISPELSLEIHGEAARSDVRLLDVAISGSTPAVEAGTITLLAGGDAETFERSIPVYQSIAKQWFLMGPAGAGIQMKLVVNLLLGVGMQAIAEALNLGEHLQLDREALLDVLSKTAVVAPAFQGKFAKIRNADYSPQFPLRLMSKDLNLVVDAAASAGAELPVASAAQEVFASRVAEDGDLDLSVVASAAGVESAV
jgi:3-hydroxyisobutyrate dehydrogenase-like beta-hydroxyacid dehydrogenase